MEDLRKQLAALTEQVEKAWQTLKLDALITEDQQLQARMSAPDFWNDSQTAQAVSKQQAKLSSRIEPWQSLHKGLEEMTELAATDDQSLRTEISQQLDQLGRTFGSLKNELKFNGPYDDHDVIMTIHAGAGGTDAQDWAQMLLRMYTRWAEAAGHKVTVLEESSGDEAGLKSVSLVLEGSMLYGKLKGEHGVHRLVRLSPFNADNLRQTSFAKVDILPRIEQQSEVAIDEAELRVDVYRAGGHGGQSVNTTDSAVRVTHIPTGISVAIQNERSQLQNREVAMTILRSKLAQLQLEQHQERLADLKGPNQSAEWGNQIRSYVLHPYKQVKDLRSRYETSDADKVLDGNLDGLIEAYLEHSLQAS